MTGEGRRSGKVEKSLRSVIQTVRGCSYGDVTMPVALEVETELPAWREEGLFSHAQSNGNWFRFLFVSTAASAQTASKGNISFGYSYVRADLSPNHRCPEIGNSNLNGWYISAEYKLIPWFGAVADFGAFMEPNGWSPFAR